MPDILIRLHDVAPEDEDAVERWLDEVLPTHEAIADYTISDPAALPAGIQPDPIGELFSVADDAEAQMLDQLRRRAGQVWECYGDDPERLELNSCWTNPASATHCESCGTARPDSKSEAS